MNEAVTSTRADAISRHAELKEMTEYACDLLKAMSNEWRLMILCHLSEGEKNVSELQELLGLSQSALSQHLAVLRRERIVRRRKEAQTVTYFLAGGDATAIMNTLHDIFCGEFGTKQKV